MWQYVFFGFIIVIGFIVFITILNMVQNKTLIDFKSFLAETIPLHRGKFGIYCFTGKQGTGKTYSTVKFILDNYADHKNIYSNISIAGIEYTKIKSAEHLLSLRYEKDAVIIFDEIFSLLDDKTIDKKLRPQLMNFMSQQRKMGNIMITTAQEWLELPMTYRRFVRIQIDCDTRPLGTLGGILTEYYYDATKMKWDQLENEYLAPIINTKLSKYQKRIMISYDTFERVDLINVSGGGGVRARGRDTPSPTPKLGKGITTM